MTSQRPEHLPDFKNPPLNEVVLSVQFNPPNGYQQILAGEVWKLFRNAYPRVQEVAPLMPAFETFGFPSLAPPPFRFIDANLEHNRYWFLTETGDELLQFQQDRFLHNWRKVGDETNNYPRFETMIERFEEEITKLEEHMSSLSKQSLQINQCEVTYINYITGNPLKASEWLSFLNFNSREPEDFTVTFRELINDSEGNPRGRLNCETKVGYRKDNTKIFLMNLTARGAPQRPDIRSALDFIETGREIIVTRFAEFTTKSAHKNWGRIK